MGYPDLCMYFSAAGALFLTSVGIVFSTSSIFYAEGIEDVTTVRTSVWGAAIMYAVTFAVSLAMVKSRSVAPEDDDEPGVGMQPIHGRGYQRFSSL
ncbi:hypothetical protein TeGR_g1906 [Tetraparma gracilis]|uniref:Uncharacterized protein n=1 Tax=Tetraparma gracilis TaxID=2962635 RepID=A0ABQ6MVC2_9STRA|nr:hypothetical protein TeGR_g1906 [Tetraparma gracilis]